MRGPGVLEQVRHDGLHDVVAVEVEALGGGTGGLGAGVAVAAAVRHVRCREEAVSDLTMYIARQLFYRC